MKMRLRRPSPAMVIAIAALFFALGGGAMAAVQRHYVITSTKQIKPSVLKKLKGAKGPRGTKGPQGGQGATGAQGAKGDTGPAGPLVTPEAWHEVGTSGEPAFGTSWSNYTTFATSAAFYKDPFGVVHLKGWVTNGGATFQQIIFGLPEGYRPTKTTCIGSVDQSATPPRALAVCIGASGAVQEPYNFGGGAVLIHVALDGITFRAGTG